MNPAMRDFDVNEKLLSLESVISSLEAEVGRLKETVGNYEEKCRDMELDDMIEDGGELADMDGEAHVLHDYVAATNRMNKYFENKLEKLTKETDNG